MKKVFCNPPGCRCLVVSTFDEKVDIEQGFLATATNIYDNDVPGVIIKVDTSDAEAVQRLYKVAVKLLKSIENGELSVLNRPAAKVELP